MVIDYLPVNLPEEFKQMARKWSLEGVLGEILPMSGSGKPVEIT